MIFIPDPSWTLLNEQCVAGIDYNWGAVSWGNLLVGLAGFLVFALGWEGFLIWTWLLRTAL